MYGNQLAKRTQHAFLWNRILDIPFWGLINMLTFILYKDLHITPLEITAIVALKPISSLLAPYWSQAIYQRPDRIVSNLIWANLFRYLPFLFIPWIASPWFAIIGFGFYMTLYRGAIPGWMEILKCNLPETSRERIIGFGNTINYGGTAVFALLLGMILDTDTLSWRWLFLGLALLGLTSTVFLLRVPSLPINEVAPTQKVGLLFNLRAQILRPWNQSWQLIRSRSDFASYQIGFMLGGAGLMIIQPALPLFFVDTLNLSFLELGIALALCKGLGVAFATPFWTRLFRKINIFNFSGYVTILAALFPVLLMIAPMDNAFLYFAYILYGVMQAGSEMSWYMSGLVFANEKESSPYSATNVLTVGMRGCVIPALGAGLLSATGAISVMSMGMVLSVLATLHLMLYSRRRSLITILK